jgi:hypothetical protein
VPLLASVSEDLVARGAEGVEEEPTGGWVEDLNDYWGLIMVFEDGMSITTMMICRLMDIL